MFKALEISLEEDISQFSRLLWQHKLSHQVHLGKESQIVAVAKVENVAEVFALYKQWRQGDIKPTEQDSSNVTSYFSGGEFLGKSLRAFTRTPFSLCLIVLCCILAVFAPLDAYSYTELTQLLMYPNFNLGTGTINLTRVWESFTLLQLLKMITPMLLHAGLLHLAFNMLWLWEFGKRIEAVQASWSMLLLVLVLALVSNTIQFVYGGGNNFGGMSGVVYGLFGYIWMWQLFDPQKRLGLPRNLVIFMLISLAIITSIGLENIADSAHVGGLLCGVVYGAFVATISRIQRASKIEQSK